MKPSYILGIIALMGILSFLMEYWGVYDSSFDLETKSILNMMSIVGYFIVKSIESKL